MSKELKRPMRSDFGTKQEIEYQKALNKYLDQLEVKLEEAEEENKKLRDNYNRRLKAISVMINDIQFKDDANPDYIRLKTKASCYRTFLSELIQQDMSESEENIWKTIWSEAISQGFQFNETDAHNVFVAIKSLMQSYADEQNKVETQPLKSECEHDYSDGTGTGYNVCRKCGDMY